MVYQSVVECTSCNKLTKWKWKSLSHVRFFATPWTIQSMEFSRPEYCSLLQGIFPTQGSNPGLLHCRQTLYQLSHQGSPINWQTPCKWLCGDVPRVAWLGLIQMLCVSCRLGSWRGSWNWDFFFLTKATIQSCFKLSQICLPCCPIFQLILLNTCPSPLDQLLGKK